MCGSVCGERVSIEYRVIFIRPPGIRHENLVTGRASRVPFFYRSHIVYTITLECQCRSHVDNVPWSTPNINNIEQTGRLRLCVHGYGKDGGVAEHLSMRTWEMTE